MDRLVEQIADAVRECSCIMMKAERNPAMIDSKEGHANFVTTYDKKVQEELFRRLSEILPEATLVGEEEDIHSSIEKGYAFIVDPIDGTTNFIKDYKMSCISVGLTKDGQQFIGVVYNPYLDEMFTAQAGEGAFLNGEPIHVTREPMSNSIVVVGTAPYYRELREKTFHILEGYIRGALDIRRSGSAALDLCAVAAGRVDHFVELRLCPWDLAAGALIVKEAGGIVMTPEGQNITLDRQCGIVASNGIKEIYLAGGCYWGVEKYVSNIKGVISTKVGFANGDTENPTYEQVKHENTGHAETVQVVYDAKELSLKALLNLFYRIIDPTSVDKQGEDEGHQYRTGIYFTDPLDEDTVKESLLALEKQVGQKLVVEACPLEHFYDAEEYHQKYLDKNPGGYCHVPLAEIMWVKTINPMDFE